MIALEIRDLAQSCFRLMTKMAELDGADPEITDKTWDQISSEEQAFWLNLSHKAAKTMLNLEGLPMLSVAKALFLLGVPQDESSLLSASNVYDNVANPLYRLKWEALARHIHALMDCEELRSAEESEQFFLQWYAKKMASILSTQGVDYVA